ncbi:Aldo/keto reductase [Mycena venus]|uniref:Aldo/keto reductase n=1 Tax=Mycena venus TaxID=2733690 RepID=A0A8H6XRT0_9AGAR|nr:Aldo/keto reductase [Mycena venus]
MADTEKWFLSAFKAGYRHVDTAYAYGKPILIGLNTHESQSWHHPKYVQRSFEESLSRLDLGYVDLYLLHFPQTVEYPNLGGYEAPATFREMVTELKIDETHTFNETWADFERLHASGKARAIGVSNFSIKTLEQLLKTAKIVPAVNQIEMHPYLVQTELLEYCREKGIVVIAYSPTGKDKVRNDPTISELSKKHKVTPTQIILAWHLARGVVAVPKSTNSERQKENITLPTLSAEDVARVTALDRNERIGQFGPDGKLAGWTKEQYGW